MQSHSYLVRLAILSLALGPLAVSGVAQVSVPAPSPTATPLPASWQQKPLAVMTQQDMTFPVVSNGYVLSHTRHITSEGAGQIAVTALATGKSAQLPFWLPNAIGIRIESVAMTPANHVLIAGAYRKTGPNSGVVLNYVSEMDLTGKVLATYDLGDYTPERICSANDGSFWTFGQVWAEENKENGTYALFRQYTPAGVLKRSFLPRGLLPTNVTLNYHTHALHGNWAFLRCGDDSAAVYFGKGTPGFVWFEVETATGNSEMWTVRNPNYAIVNGLALFHKHTAYASFDPTHGADTGGLYRLTPGPSQTATWTPVGDNDGPMPILLGSDHGSLVYSRDLTKNSASALFYWRKAIE